MGDNFRSWSQTSHTQVYYIIDISTQTIIVKLKYISAINRVKRVDCWVVMETAVTKVPKYKSAQNGKFNCVSVV